MAFHGYDLVFLKFIKYLLYITVRAIFGVFQTIYWSQNGTLKKLRDSKKEENYHQCVQVMNIHAVYTFDLLKVITREYFILTHDRFESPDYIFKNDHISLMTLEEDGAIFAEALPGQQLWKSEFNSFIRIAQTDRAVKLHFVPMNHFLRMAKERGEPSELLVFIFNTARCGSTLFTQMMEMTDCSVAFSEPDSLMKITEWQRRRGDTQELRNLTEATIRWLCRPYKDFKPKCVAIKLCAPCVFSLEMLTELYPNCKNLFMYRGIEKNAKSFYRLAQELPLLKLCFTLGKYSEYFVEKLLNGLGLYGKDFSIKVVDDIDLGIFVYAVMSHEYLRRRKAGFPCYAIRYEDIIGKDSKLFAAKAIMKYCGLPEDLATKALRGLEMDSQRNSPISMAILSKHKDPELTPGAKQRGNEILKKFGLPLIESDGIMEGTITTPPKTSA